MDSTHKLRGGRLVQVGAAIPGVDRIEFLRHFLFIPRDVHAAHRLEAAGSGQLVVVALFGKCGLSGHDQDRLAKLQGGQDRSDARMRDDRIGPLEEAAKLGRRDLSRPADVFRFVVRRTDLCENIHLTPSAGPVVDGRHEAIEG